MSGDSSLIRFVDQATILYIQSRAPAISRLDADDVREGFKAKRIFPGVTDNMVRGQLERNLLQIEILIPSIHTLFKDLRYLEPAAKAIKALLPPSNTKKTLREDLRFLITETDDQSLEIQDTEESFSRIKGSFNHLFDLAIRQLFLASLRYFTPPSNVSSKKNMNPLTQTVNASKRFLGFRLIYLSQRLGFVVRRVDGEEEDPVKRLFTDMLGTLPKELFQIKSIPESLYRAFQEYLLKCAIPDNSSLSPVITTPDAGEPLSRRCGRSCLRDSHGDRVADRANVDCHLFLRKMHQPLSTLRGAGYGISSFYVKRCIYTAFFGSLKIDVTADRDSREAEDYFDEAGIFEEYASGSGGSTRAHSESASEEPQAANKEHSNDNTSTSYRTISPISAEQPQERDDGSQVRFVDIQGRILQHVAFARDTIREEAKKYAEAGFSIMDEQGKHWLWDECYDILIDSESRTLIIVSPKKRHGEEELRMVGVKRPRIG